MNFLSGAINRYLHLDPESAKRFEKLNGKTFAIELLPFSICFYCVFSEDGVTITTNTNNTPETTLRGTPLQLLAVAIAKDARHRFFAEDVVMEGNAELGQKVIELFDELSIDWEEYASQLVGDVPAHHAGNLVRRAKNWFQHINKSFTQNVDEYVHEETACFPGNEEVQEFFSGVDHIRMDVDRLEARINQLSNNRMEDEAAS